MESRRYIPKVTIFFVGINILIWLVLEFVGDTENSIFMLMHGASYPPVIMENGQWWRLFTCMFLHFGADHLVNNMLMLSLMGMRLEYTLGSFKFAVLYVFSGLCGSFCSFLAAMESTDAAVSAGASGAVFGVIGALLAWALWHKGHVEGLTVKGLLGMAALSLYYGFSASGVDNWGHIGGLLGGFILGCVYSFFKKIDFIRKN